MSRIGNKPVALPSNVKAKLDRQQLAVEGPKGKLLQRVHPRLKVTVGSNQITVERATDMGSDKALHGLTRSLIQNMVTGVTEGFKKELEMEGVGYKAQVKGKVLNLAIGYTHPIDYEIPEGIEVKCPRPTNILISGSDKQKVGQVAAEIRRYHEPEPYKGKGIRYSDEQVRRKQGKKVG